MTERVITLPGVSLDLLGKRVVRDGRSVKVEPRAWRVLEQLARFRHRVVTKAELLAALRPEGAASDDALRQAVRAARRAIGDAGPVPIIRSIPRVGYIFDVPPARGARPAAGVRAESLPSVIIGPLRDETGRPGLQWASHGLVAAIAHGLSLDGRLQVQDARSLETSWSQRPRRVLQILHAAGARHAVVGSLRTAGRGFALELQVHALDEETAVEVRAAAPAGLVVPAVEALRQRLLGAGARRARADALRRCAPLSIELFARARHCAAVHGDRAALRALELLQRLEPGFPRLDLELVRAQAVCGSDDDGQASAERLLEAARRDGDPALEAQVHQCLGTLHHVKGRLREAARSLAQALVLGRGCMPPHWQGHTLTLLASVECRLGELHSVQTRLDEAQATFTRIGSHWGLLNVLWLRAIMSSLSGHAEQSIRWNRKLVSVARRLNANAALVGVCVNLAGELVYADRLEEARACAEEATATALAIEAEPALLGTVVNVHCLIHRQQGRPDAAAQLLSLLPHPARGGDEGYLWQAHGHAAMAAGRVDEAADHFLQAAAEYRRRDNRMAEAPLLPWLVEALVRSGRSQLAQAELDRAAAQPHLQDESTTANLLYPRALLARRRQQEPEAHTLLARLATAPAALPLFRRLGQELSALPVELQGVPPPPVAPSGGMLRPQYRFGHCVVDVERRELWVDGRRQTLAPKPFEVLVHLVRNRHRLVTRDELLDIVWDEAPGTPEVVAQAIAKIRQAMRRSRTHAVRVQTLYGKGYRLLADAQAQPEDDSAAVLLSQLHAAPPQRLAVVPLRDRTPAGGADDHDLRYPLDVLGYTLAVRAQLQLMSAAEVQALVDGAAAGAPESVAAAIARGSPEVHVLFARLARRADDLALEYVLVSPAARTEGSLHDRSPTALGRRLAARLLQRPHALRAPAHGPAGDEDAWIAQMLDLASRAAEEHRRGDALRILEVVLDQDPDHALAAELKARIGAGGGAG